MDNFPSSTKSEPHAIPADLEENALAWFQETAGAHALVNQSDTRLGVVQGTGQADLLMAGFERGTGLIPPLNLARATDPMGCPVGYRLLVGVDQLRTLDRGIFDKLDPTFRFKDIDVALGGTSGSNAKRLVDRFLSLGIVRKDGRSYAKTEGSQQCVACME